MAFRKKICKRKVRGWLRSGVSVDGLMDCLYALTVLFGKWIVTDGKITEWGLLRDYFSARKSPTCVNLVRYKGAFKFLFGMIYLEKLENVGCLARLTDEFLGNSPIV